MRKVFAILDIETITDARIAFDVAWILYDGKGNELERHNYLIKEVCDMPYFKELLHADRFMKDKADFYENGNFTIASLADVQTAFYAATTKYNAQVVMCAYNARFDYSVLNDNMNTLHGINFFNDNTEIVDIMTMALSTMCDSNNFVRWCQLHDYMTEKGNVKTSAESVYAYISKDAEFVEAHHALKDCEIEAQIFFKARNYHKKLHTAFAWPVFSCKEWKKVQARKH